MAVHNGLDKEIKPGAVGGAMYDYDVVVIGGGPAGSTVATLLSQWGRGVLLLEKEHFPRHHIGESLLPLASRVMERLGVLDKVERAKFVHKLGATYVWGKTRQPWTISFSEMIDDTIHAYQVERARFDTLLLEHSRECGARVQEGCRVTEVLHEDGRVTGVRYLDEAGVLHTVSSQFCVDASGQGAIIGRSMRFRRFNRPLRNIALYAYFRGGKPVVEFVHDLSPQSKGNIFVVAVDIGWIWYIPLGDTLFSVGLVTDASLAQGINQAGRRKFYLDTLATTPEISFLLREARMESDSLYTQSDWSYICRSFQGPGYLLVGDAACFVDPILSTGVTLAMDGGLQAALTINTVLSDPQLTNWAMNWYEEQYRGKFQSFLQMAVHWYKGHRNQDAWFWQAKQLLDSSSNLSIRQAFILLTAGFAAGLPSQEPPELQEMGGFSSSQVKTIYDHLDSAVLEQAREKLMQQFTPATLALKKLAEGNGENVAMSCPRFAAGMRYTISMDERDNFLQPFVQIVHEEAGIPKKQINTPITSLPLFERIDGKHQVREIAAEVAALLGGEQEDGMRDLEQTFVTAIIQELYRQHVIEPV